MEKTIFYSWQSDLPKNKNLNFIEASIKSALKKLHGRKPISVDLKFDKATRSLAGSPDIAESIFTKIAGCNVFIADISIINPESENSRKTSNPNVLIELGFAARALGWEKIICIYNNEFGDYKDLPFDLRNRRIMDYSCNRSKNELSSKIESAIIEMNAKGNLTDKILDFLKKEIDKEILGLLSHLLLITDFEGSKKDLFAAIQTFLNLSKEDLLANLKGKKILGFYLFKVFDEYGNKIHNYINQALGSPYYNREILNSLIDIYEWFAEYSKFRTNFFSKLFMETKEKEDDLFIIKGSNMTTDKLPNRYILMKRIDEEKGIVSNFGDFPIGVIPNLTNYFILNENILDRYCDIIFLLISSINKWLDVSNNEFIFDFTKQWRIKKTDGEWL